MSKVIEVKNLTKSFKLFHNNKNDVEFIKVEIK